MKAVFISTCAVEVTDVSAIATLLCSNDGTRHQCNCSSKEFSKSVLKPPCHIENFYYNYYNDYDIIITNYM